VSNSHIFADVQSHAPQVGSDSVIAVDTSDILALFGDQLSSLQHQDFLLV
jgi:hypothetical protein